MGADKAETDLARKAVGAKHDRFNLFAIPPLVFLTGCSLFQPSRATHDALSWSVLSYTMLDTAYNVLVPQCQPNFRRWASIVLHHSTAAWLTMFPIRHPELGHLTSYCTIVEINTMFLTFSKAFKSKMMTKCHLASWGILRLCWYPYLVYHFHRVVCDSGIKVGAYEYFQTVGSQAILCSLNFFWTVEVCLGMLRAKPKDTKNDEIKDEST
eukprot:gb/GFBE01062845.1/.p1 GENE.gb/GFBE01062845.1/~~gb/GFBE01062845.1/.p1  ORF type:complete len:211 (+),score=35.07 gb/GFBE01062845.1/:1-633(+)